MKVIFHVDVNSAFLSWTAVNRIKFGDKTDIRETAAVIGGDETSRRGVVLAKSEKAKKLGVVTGESLYSARQKCPELKVYAPDFSIYRSCSDEMYNILCEYTDKIERYSIDECFMDMGCMSAETAYRSGSEIKDKIKNSLGFTVSVGISNNKVLAKMASELKKPDKANTLYSDEIKEKLWPLPVDDLFMVGKKASRKLKDLNIYYIGDLAQYDVNVLILKFKSYGKLIWEYANGVDNSQVEYNESESKVIGNSVTLAKDILNFSDAEKILKELAEKVAGSLRKTGRYTNAVTVHIKTNDFVSYSHQRKMEYSTDSTEIITKACIELFHEMWKKEPLRLIGVSVSNLVSVGFQQISIFNSRNIEKRHRLDKTIDDIKNKYGENAILSFKDHN